MANLVILILLSITTQFRTNYSPSPSNAQKVTKPKTTANDEKYALAESILEKKYFTCSQ